MDEIEDLGDSDLPVIMIFDSDDQVEQFIIFRQPKNEHHENDCLKKMKRCFAFSGLKESGQDVNVSPTENDLESDCSSDQKQNPESSDQTKTTSMTSNNKAFSILVNSFAKIQEQSKSETKPLWRKLKMKEVSSEFKFLLRSDEWDKADELVAIGRRIYDRSEVEIEWISDLNNLPSVLRLKELDFKQISEAFGLWDEVYEKEVVKELEASQMWEPGLKDKELEKRKKEQSKPATTHQPIVGPKLLKEELNDLQQNTKFDSQTIKQWHKAFYEECPSGQLTKDHLSRMLRCLFPDGNNQPFCDTIFRIFGGNCNATPFLTFRQFLNAMNITTLKSKEDKLRWAFKLYDVDNSGSINASEMNSVIRMMDELEGLSGATQESVTQRASDLFDKLDVNGDGEITLDEFIQGYIRRRRSLAHGVKTFQRVHLTRTTKDNFPVVKTIGCNKK